MTETREAFIRRVRQALTAGARPGTAPGLESRGLIGYQGAGSDPLQRFCAELTAVGGHAHRVPNRAGAVQRLRELIKSSSARRVLLGRGELIDALNLSRELRSEVVDLRCADEVSTDSSREEFFAAELAITGVHALVAETGTIVLLSAPAEPRSLSLLPPIHIAVAERAQLIPDLFDLFETCLRPEGGSMPSCISLITGPSKTGDIELRLVTGVHGPGEIHVVLVDA